MDAVLDRLQAVGRTFDVLENRCPSTSSAPVTSTRRLNVAERETICRSISSESPADMWLE